LIVVLHSQETKDTNEFEKNKDECTGSWKKVIKVTKNTFIFMYT